MATTTTDKPRLKALFDDEVRAKVLKEFKLGNTHEVPKLAKIIINSGIGRFLDNQKLKPEIRDEVVSTLTAISGQKPIMLFAKKSVANFHVREGAPSAFMVTLRGDRMWHFLDRLLNLAIPRIKDFRGLKDTSFDKAGNYSMGLTEQAVWPEINMAQVNFNHGMNVNFTFENSTPEQSKFLLAALGMPFKKDEE
ncbi:MAG: 50S ribosomal protein L5 [Phycisphaerales bacterium]|nr:50S ribosomal protein L5 [Phycisphaerales bacterium]